MHHHFLQNSQGKGENYCDMYFNLQYFIIIIIIIKPFKRIFPRIIENIKQLSTSTRFC